MRYRELGKTGIRVSEIGFGAEWMVGRTAEEVRAVTDRCEELGINIFDCWMAEPNVRTHLGQAIAGRRDKWIIEGHIGSTWQNGQYTRTRDMQFVEPAFEDLLARLGVEYLDLGMMHYIDKESDYETAINGPFYKYMESLKREGRILHIGMSTHNPKIAARAVREGVIENMLFSVNPAFDMMSTDELEDYYSDSYDTTLAGISQDRVDLYRLCEQEGVGITVMKPYAGGRLFRQEWSPFGVALTPVQCLHYALTRPAVASVMVGVNTPQEMDAAVAYETASEKEKDYASVLAHAPSRAYTGHQCTYCGHCAPCPAGIDIATVNKFYDLAVMPAATDHMAEGGAVPAGIADHYRQLDVKASACVQCGGCEERCPFGVPVRERMEKTAALFGE